MTAELRLGPLVRWVGEAGATVWVETDGPCEVEVLGRRQPTFTIDGHHYALVTVDGLEPGSRTPYEVRLDGRMVWPRRGHEQAPSVITTLSAARGLRLAFGSCHVSGPRSALLGLDRWLKRYDPALDALVALARRLAHTSPQDWPDQLLLLGDQVYADDIPRATRQAIARRRGLSGAGPGSVADFEDYTQLYHDSWSEPDIRWLLSTVPSAMIFDDHELVDDWDTSAAWVAERRAEPGWGERLSGALMSYWLYQHLGNLSPDELQADELYQGVVADGDGSERLRTWVHQYDRDHAGSRWAYRRDLGETRLLVLDTRATRVLEPGHRDMLDPAEWEWLERNVSGARHLLIASSVPVVYALGFHHVQTWLEAVADGAWGRIPARLAEQARRALSASGWPSFRSSFARLMGLLEALASGQLGDAPRSITLLSGDVHHGYVARVDWPSGAGRDVPVHQVVTSPLRNLLQPHERLAQRIGASHLGGALFASLARVTGVPPTEVGWQRLEGLEFANQVSTLRVDADGVWLSAEAAHSAGDGGPGRLVPMWQRRLA